MTDKFRNYIYNDIDELKEYLEQERDTVTKQVEDTINELEGSLNIIKGQDLIEVRVYYPKRDMEFIAYTWSNTSGLVQLPCSQNNHQYQLHDNGNEGFHYACVHCNALSSYHYMNDVDDEYIQISRTVVDNGHRRANIETALINSNWVFQ